MSEPHPIVIPIRADTRPMEEEIAAAGEKAGSEGGKKSAAAFSQKLGVGLAGAGAGLDKFARSSAAATQQLGRIAAATGLPINSLRDLAASTSNAGFETGEVLDVFQELSKQGVNTQGDLKRVANVWDEVAHATGGNATELAKSANSLAAFGISAKNPEKALNALGAVAFHTKDGIDGFTGFLQKQGPTLAKYGLNVDDIAAAMVALNAHGLSGRKAQSAFSAAIKASNGNIKDALGTLGVGAKEYDKFHESVKEGGEQLEKSAKQAEDTITPMQKLHAWFSALILRSGKFGEAAGIVGSVLVGMGSALGAAGSAARFFDTTLGKKLVDTLKKTATALKLSNIQATLMAAKAKILAIATKAWAIAQRLLNLVMSSNPIVRVVLILIALGAALVLAYKKSETFRKIVQAAFKIVKEVIESVVNFVIHTVPQAFEKLVDGITSVYKSIAGFFSGLYKKIVDVFVAAGTWLLNAGKAILQGLWTGLKFYFTILWTWYVKIPLLLIGVFVNALVWLYNAGKNILLGLWNGIKAVWAIVSGWFLGLGAWIIGRFTAAGAWLFNAGKNVIQGLWNGIKAIWTVVWNFLSGIGNVIINLFKNAGAWLLGAGSRILSGLWNGLKAGWNTAWTFLKGIGSAVIGVFKNAGTWLLDAGGKIISGLWNGIKSVASKGIGFVANIGASIVNWIISGINNVLDLPWTLHIPLPVVPDIGPLTLLPRIPLLKAEGGLITGPGTSTSDSIPVNLSDGEYVVNARATKEWLPLLNAINWGRAVPNAGSVNDTSARSAPSVVAPMLNGDKAVVVNQNYYGPTTSSGRRRETEWALKYGTV